MAMISKRERMMLIDVTVLYFRIALFQSAVDLRLYYKCCLYLKSKLQKSFVMHVYSVSKDVIK